MWLVIYCLYFAFRDGTDEVEKDGNTSTGGMFCHLYELAGLIII